MPLRRLGKSHVWAIRPVKENEGWILKNKNKNKTQPQSSSSLFPLPPWPTASQIPLRFFATNAHETTPVSVLQMRKKLVGSNESSSSPCLKTYLCRRGQPARPATRLALFCTGRQSGRSSPDSPSPSFFILQLMFASLPDMIQFESCSAFCLPLNYWIFILFCILLTLKPAPIWLVSIGICLLFGRARGTDYYHWNGLFYIGIRSLCSIYCIW
jgi:hypothetical protein